VDNSLLEMLPGEVAERIESGADIAIIPIGSIEQHGPHLLTGCDLYCVMSRCIAIARETGGTIFAPVPFSWVGCTNYFSGGVGVREEVFIRYLRAVIRGAWASGFRRILVVNGHGGNFYAMMSLPRDSLAEDGIPVMAIYSDAGAPGTTGHSEASSMTAGLKMLGKDDVLADARRYIEAAVKEFGEGAEAVVWPEPYLQARKLGVVGHDYLDELRHVQPTMDYDPESGVANAEAVAKHVAGLLEEFKAVVDETTGAAGAAGAEK